MPPTTTPLTTSWRKKLTGGAPGGVGRRRSRVLHRHQAHGGADLRLAAIFVADVGLDLQLFQTRVVEGVDDLPVALRHEAAPDLAGPRQLVVVRVQLLVERDETSDLRDLREVPVDSPDLAGEELEDLGLLGQV